MADDETHLFRTSWGLYDALSEKNYMFHREIYAIIAGMLQQRHEQGGYSMLDLGCGNTRFLAPCLHAAPPARYEGVDLSQTALDEARGYLSGLSNVTLRCQDMLQANAVVETLKEWIKPTAEADAVMRWVTGGAMAAITAAVILGGVKSIARVCEVLVPVMALGYILGCVLILIKNATLLPGALGEIWQGAFSGQAAVGGFVGAGIRQAIQAGIARGLFSNESGLGSAPIVAAAAQTRNPVRQALVSSTATFWDTVVVCAITGLVIVSSGHWKEGMPKGALTNAAFEELHTIGPIFLLFGLITFVFSSILGWCYYGEKAAEYLVGPKAVKPYRVLWVIMVLVGAVQPAAAVMDFSDAANGLMAVPNLICLICLSGVIAAETRAHAAELRGKD